MVDTVRTIAFLKSNLFQDGQVGTITAQDERDLIVTLNQVPGNFIFAAAPEYGVKADGVTNDTAAWTAAFTAAATKGMTVLAPPGISMVSALSIPTGVTLQGACTGANTYLGASTLGTVIRTIAGSNVAPTITTATGVTVRDLTVEGVGLQNGIQFGQMNRIYNVFVYNATAGIYGNFAGNASIIAFCHLNECTSAGIANCVDCHIIGCVISSGGNQGLLLDSGCNLNMIVGCRIEWSVAQNIFFNACQNNVMSGCSVDRAGASGIYINGCQNICITGNNFGRSGAQQNGSSNNPDDSDFRLAGNVGCSIVGNTAWVGANDDTSGYKGPYYAIYDGGTNTNCVIVGNILRWHANSATTTGAVINITTTFNPATTGNNACFWS